MPRMGSNVDLTAQAAPAAPPSGRARLYATTSGPLAVRGATGGARTLTAMGAHSVRDYGAAGDGVANDAPAIQAAMDAASAGTGGGRVVIPEGNYLLGADLECKGSLWIDAAPGARMIRNHSGPYMLKNFNPSYGPTVYNGRGGIVVTGGIWDANGVANSAPACAVVFAHCRNIRMEGVQIRNVPDWHALELNAVSGAVIRDCVFEGFRVVDSARTMSEALQLDVASSSAAIPHIGSASWDHTPCEKVLVTGCRMGPARDGSGLGAYGKLVGSHNDSTGVYQTDIQIIANSCEGALDTAIQAVGWTRSVIADNVIRGAAGAGIKYDIMAATAPADFSVLGNTISGAAGGGIAVDGTGGTITRPTITGNTILATSGGGMPGLYVINGRQINITGNTLTNSETSGIYLDGCVEGSVSGNYVLVAGSHGVNLIGSSLLLVEGNRVSETGQSCLILSAGSSDNVITSNYLRGASSAAAGGSWTLRLTNSANHRNTIIGNVLAKRGSGNEAPAAIGFDGSAPVGNTVVGNVMRGWSTYATAINTSGATIMDDITAIGQANTPQA